MPWVANAYTPVTKGNEEECYISPTHYPMLNIRPRGVRCSTTGADTPILRVLWANAVLVPVDVRGKSLVQDVLIIGMAMM